MLIFKYVFVLRIQLLLVIMGIIGIAVPNNLFPQQSSANSNLTGYATADELKLSTEFYRYEYLINNSAINKSIESEINKLENEFEKDYLIALLKNRNKMFSDAYNLLVKHLDSFPPLYRYYDLLVQSANITNKLIELSKTINWEDKKKISYSVYLNGMIEFARGRYAKTVKLLSSLIIDRIESKEIYYSLTYAYRNIGNYEKGLENLIKAENLVDSSNFFCSKILNGKGFFVLSFRTI